MKLLILATAALFVKSSEVVVLTADNFEEQVIQLKIVALLCFVHVC